MPEPKQKPSGQAAAISANGGSQHPQHMTTVAPIDELIARFQLETERAISGVRQDLERANQTLARKVAQLEDKVTEMTDAATRQVKALEEGLHHTRQAVQETNEAMKVAAKAAQEARDSAAVYEKLKDSQPDYAAQVRGLERRLAEVVDKNTHLEEMLAGLTKQLGEFEVIADAIAS